MFHPPLLVGAGLGPPLTWGQMCAEGPVDKGEMQHNGCAGVLGLGEQIALTGILKVLGLHLNPGEGDSSVQAVLLCHLQDLGKEVSFWPGLRLQLAPSLND